MQANLSLISDQLSPDFQRRLAAVTDRRKIHNAIGLTLVSLTKRAFNQPDLRAAVWPAKHDGSKATLRKSGTLAKSIRVLTSSSSFVAIGTDRKYAAIHQLGGTTKPHVIRPKNGKALKTPFGIFAKVNHPGSKVPARPYFPFYKTGQPTPRAMRDIINTIDAAITPRV